MFLNFKSIQIFCGLLFLIIVSACSITTEITQETTISENDTIVDTEAKSVNLSDYLVKPELAFFSIDNTIPEVFQVETNREESNPNSGFRVQIISTQDINEAELVRIEFNKWMDIEIDEYEANAYILFRQPYYKLHVGDFKSRADAIHFGSLLKRKFPDALVVFDIINPSNITVRRTRN